MIPVFLTSVVQTVLKCQVVLFQVEPFSIVNEIVGVEIENKSSVVVGGH